ncbi:hypothetical protein [Microbacterium profundi]|uniref:hypothetical protein n=1 Tax=Microbacterium profundi TaxID=450380 RepID=UPI00126A5037|nr:hypothetical protein [Microbacterium profundi]
MSRVVGVVIALAVVVGAAGCGAPRPVPQTSSSDSAATAAASPLLTTDHPVMVIERDGEADLCFVVMQSWPPLCGGGPRLVDWDWMVVPGTYEEAMGVRWGEYVVTGIYDAQTNELTVETVTAAPEPPRADTSAMGPPLPTACPEPDGGWRILDESTANQEALYAVGGVAATLDGYATMWIDRSPLPPVPDDADPLEQLHHYAVYAGLNIVTVAVRGDAVAAEQRLREVWGGALCVITVDYTEADRQALLQEVMDEYAARGLTIAGMDGVTGVIGITVVYDFDGALQQELDERYGPGLIRVHSALTLA